MSKELLDDLSVYEELDVADVGYGVEHFPEQFLETWDQTKGLKLPKKYSGLDHIVVIGMGGSQLGPHVIETALKNELKVPFIRSYGYSVPKFVGKRSLVILSSFSGTTEEVLAAGKEVLKTGAKVLSISAGGKLETFAKKNGIPHHHITPGELAKEPRLGVGFSLMGLLAFLNAGGYVKLSKARVDRLVAAMVEVIDTCSVEVEQKDNPAKLVAAGLKERIVYVVAAEHLEGAAHIITNQINESGKQLAVWHTLPELNHHFLEGTLHPEGAFEEFTVLMVNSSLYHKRNQKRFELTADIFEEQGAEVIEYHARGKGELEEAVELMQFGNYLTYYMAMQNGVNPREIPFVDRFKAALK